ncbi:MAG: hypothetical protein KDJ65_09135 [Anaerolineae bacterium]|nr:hypothetical protein [Anaerolineae bacterium]
MFNNKWFSIAVGSGLAVLLLLGLLTVLPAFAQGGGTMGNNDGRMMGGSGSGGMMGSTQGFTSTNQFGFNPGWMMGNTQGFTSTNEFGFGPGMMGSGMMGDMMNGVMSGGMMGGGMMVNPNNPFYIAPQPLTLDETTTILNAYLADLNDSNLAYEDVMVFDNHAYAQIIEQDSGTGVMEVLIDPTTQAVVPEMGPNMMWNQKYGMMSGYGRYGMIGGMMGMMGGFNNGMMGNSFNFGSADNPAELTVSPEQAVEAAQNYLDTNFAAAGLTADDHADSFYGYYTLHVNRDGETVGMLSVNGFTGAIWPHTWHGQLLAMGAE